MYSKSHNEAQVRFRNGLTFWHLIVDISCKQCPIMKIASRLSLIIAFVSPLSCTKLSVTWTRAIVAFWIFFCRFCSRKSAIFWVLLSCENNYLFASRTDSFGQFSGTSGFSDFSIKLSRVNLVCHLNSPLSGRLSEIFGPVWLSTSSSKSIWLSISLVSDWSLVEWLGASCPSISFEGLFCFVKGNVCCCCINNWASASELASKEFVDLFCFLGLLYSGLLFRSSLHRVTAAATWATLTGWTMSFSFSGFGFSCWHLPGKAFDYFCQGGYWFTLFLIQLF